MFFLWLNISTVSHIPYFHVSNGTELEINHTKQAPLRALCKSLTTNKNLQVMKPKWTVKKLENGQIVQVYDELSDFKYFTIPWSHLSATMKDQPCWIFWYSPATNIHNEVSQVRSFPRCWWWWQISDTEMNALAEKGLAWRRGKHVHGRLVLSMLEWSVWIIFNWKRMIKGLAGWAQYVSKYRSPPLDFMARITFSTMFPSCDSVHSQVGGGGRPLVNIEGRPSRCHNRLLSEPSLCRDRLDMASHF